MTIRITSISFENEDASPEAIRGILGATGQTQRARFQPNTLDPEQKLIEAARPAQQGGEARGK